MMSVIVKTKVAYLGHGKLDVSLPPWRKLGRSRCINVTSAPKRGDGGVGREATRPRIGNPS